MKNDIFTFAHSVEIVTPIIEHYGCGWFDGGCFIFARALQLWLGGGLAVLVRQELLDEQAFDHVLLSTDNTDDSLYIDADGVTTRSELLERWRSRERLTNICLEDPANAIRFVGHLHKESLSRWLSEQLRNKFGLPDRSWLEAQLRCNAMSQISGGPVTIAGFNAGRYIRSIRSAAKKEYAHKYLLYILNGRNGSSPGSGVLSTMAAQSVRMRLDGIFQ